MKYGYNPKIKNNRWPFPTLHVFIGERSACGKISQGTPGIVIIDELPKGLYTVCRLCTHNKPSLHDKLLTT